MRRVLWPLLLVPFGLLNPGVCAAQQSNKGMSEDMRRAIAFERYKDVAAARQARKEAKNPSVTYSSADRSTDGAQPEKAVKDPGPPEWRVHQEAEKKAATKK